jgi:predicted aspartyl protease
MLLRPDPARWPALIIAGVALLLLAGQTSGAPPSCALKEVASAEARLTADNTLLVSARLDGMPMWLVLDTGAAASMISEAAARRLGLPLRDGRARVYGIDGRLISRTTRVPSLALEGAEARDQEFIVMPGGGDGTDLRPAGLFGSDYLRNYDVEIDLGQGRVNLFSPDHCPGRVVYWSKNYVESPVEIGRDGEIRLEAKLDGEAVTAQIDTGAGQTLLDAALARRRFDIADGTPGFLRTGSIRGVDGVLLPTFRWTFRTLSLAGLSIRNPAVSIVPMAPADGFAPIGSRRSGRKPDLLIGMTLITRLRLYIAYGEGRIYYTLVPAASPAGPGPD